MHDDITHNINTFEDGLGLQWYHSPIQGEPCPLRDQLLYQLSDVLQEAERNGFRIRVRPSKYGHTYSVGTWEEMASDDNDNAPSSEAPINEASINIGSTCEIPVDIGSQIGNCSICGGKIIATCKCGANKSCKECGFGEASFPCECKPAAPNNYRPLWAFS